MEIPSNVCDCPRSTVRQRSSVIQRESGHSPYQHPECVCEPKAALRKKVIDPAADLYATRICERNDYWLTIDTYFPPPDDPEGAVANTRFITTYLAWSFDREGEATGSLAFGGGLEHPHRGSAEPLVQAVYCETRTFDASDQRQRWSRDSRDLDKAEGAGAI